VTHTPTELAGVSAGLFQTARYTGGISASALIGLLFAGRSPGHALDSLVWVLLAICALLALLVLVNLFRRVGSNGGSELSPEAVDPSQSFDHARIR
jgi:NADH:ubiquinone oxidoreductase subunit H